MRLNGEKMSCLENLPPPDKDFVSVCMIQGQITSSGPKEMQQLEDMAKTASVKSAQWFTLGILGSWVPATLSVHTGQKVLQELRPAQEGTLAALYNQSHEACKNQSAIELCTPKHLYSNMTGKQGGEVLSITASGLATIITGLALYAAFKQSSRKAEETKNLREVIDILEAAQEAVLVNNSPSKKRRPNRSIKDLIIELN